MKEWRNKNNSKVVRCKWTTYIGILQESQKLRKYLQPQTGHILVLDADKFTRNPNWYFPGFLFQARFANTMEFSELLFKERHGEEKDPMFVHVWQFLQGLTSILTEMSSFLQIKSVFSKLPKMLTTAKEWR